MRENKLKFILLLLLVLSAAFLRFTQLGYSHFYGDETKVLYLRKDISARYFLLNQRKAPMQFIAAWTAEKVSSDYNEAIMRLPFAVAGFSAVIVFLALLLKLFGFYPAIFGAFLFNFNGFFVAFSRTVQYQSFLILFGLLSLLSIVWAIDFVNSNKKLTRVFLFLCGAFLALAYLSHYDAVFFDIAAGVVFVKLYLKANNKHSFIKDALFFTILPFLYMISLFYIPYFLGGYFSENTINYIARRADGVSQLPHSSLYTLGIYTPLIFIFLPATFIPFALKKYKNWKTLTLLFWFLVPFILFEVIFSNPGTHILNYVIPLIALSAAGFKTLYSKFPAIVVGTMLSVFFVLYFLVSAFIYVPFMNKGYPWKDSHFGPVRFFRPQKTHQLFLYGFPYNRGWDELREYYQEEGFPRSFYTNDNLTIGEFYLFDIPAYKPVAKGKPPEVFVWVEDNQELGIKDKQYDCSKLKCINISDHVRNFE